MVTLIIEDNTSELLVQEVLAQNGIASDIVGLCQLAIPMAAAEMAVGILQMQGVSCYVI